MVKDVEHALRLSYYIAESDLLNNKIDFNYFDLIYKETEDRWFSEDGEDFIKYYRKWLDNNKKM